MKSERLQNLVIALPVMGSMALSGRLAVSFVWAILGIASPLLAPAAHAQTRPAIELERAIAKEQVDGDLKTAMAVYQKIGGDQSAPGMLTQRKIEAAGRRFDTGDTDGRQVVYSKNSTGDELDELVHGDLAGTHQSTIFKAKKGAIGFSRPSRDFSMVVVGVREQQGPPQLWAVMKIDGTGYREVLRYGPQDDRFRDTGFENWSWDNRFWLFRGDHRILMVSVANGAVRELVSNSPDMIGPAAFSPDGRWVTYRVGSGQLGGDLKSWRERIVIVPSSGGEARIVYEQPSMTGPWPRLLDWTSDGRYLVAILTRDNRPALELLPVNEGQSTGAPILVRYTTLGVGHTKPGGGLVYTAVKPGGLWATHTAMLDTEGHVGAWEALNLRGGNVLGDTPYWSPDSGHIAYVASNEEESGGGSLNLLDLSTGEDRRIYRADTVSCRWADPRRLLCNERRDGKIDVFIVTLESGGIEPIHTFEKPYGSAIGFSLDGRALYLNKRGGAGQMGIVRRELATGQETLIDQSPPPDDESKGYVFSHDERWLARRTGQNLEVRMLPAGDWKPIVSLSKQVIANYYGFTATWDGNWL
ncbi:MAG TPA: hypothetical protein VNX60_13185, partial [Candidatus Acidoferrum sp.]|nr:hypothetical protein [Candidatus Acidoferrum sp.]